MVVIIKFRMLNCFLIMVSFLLLLLANRLKGREAELINSLLIIIATHIKNPYVCEQGCIILSNIMMNGKDENIG